MQMAIFNQLVDLHGWVRLNNGVGEMKFMQSGYYSSLILELDRVVPAPEAMPWPASEIPEILASSHNYQPLYRPHRTWNWWALLLWCKRPYHRCQIVGVEAQISQSSLCCSILCRFERGWYGLDKGFLPFKIMEPDLGKNSECEYQGQNSTSLEADSTKSEDDVIVE